jgi:hypothetical protein
MTRPTNARVAGLAFLVYIAAGLSSMRTEPGPLVDVVLAFVMCLCAFTLGVTLFAVTCDEDRDIAMMGMVCRVAEGIVGIAFMSLSLATRAARTAPAAPDAATFQAFGTLLSSAGRLNVSVGGFLFAVGSTMFCWLLLRGRLIPIVLAWLGVAASVLLVIALPLQLGHVLTAPYTLLIWIPMAAFEIPAGIWLLIKGVPWPAGPAMGRQERG